MSKSTVQYTIRNIPPALDQALRKRAKQTGKSFNQTVVETLNLQTFGKPEPPRDSGNFDWLFGASTLDQSFDEAIAEQSAIDEKLWR